MKSTHQEPEAQYQTPAKNAQLAWEAFTTSHDAATFCHGWLSVLALHVPSIQMGVVLFEDAQQQQFVPIAAWPAANKEMSQLGAVAQQALQTSKSSVQPIEEDALLTNIAYPLLVNQRALGAVSIQIASREEIHIRSCLQHMHWGIAWINDLFSRQELDALNTQTQHLGSVMETVAVALRQGKLKQTLFELANYMAREHGYSRVAIGLNKRKHIKLQALSDAAWFEKNTPAVEKYQTAMEACLDAREILLWAQPNESSIATDTDSTTNQTTSSADSHTTAFSPLSADVLQKLAIETQAQTVICLPLMQGLECVGVMTVEHDTQANFSTQERHKLEAIAGLLGGAIEQKQKAQRGYFRKFLDDGQSILRKLFGSQHLTWKVGTILAIAAIASMFIPMTYRVNAKTLIEGSTQRTVAAPFQGYLASANISAGDTVEQGAVIATLDAKDYVVEAQKSESETKQYKRKLREAMAQQALSDIQVLNTQLAQAKAQYQLSQEKIKRSTIKSPIDGVVISGDWSQQIGSPIEQGKELFRIAPLDSYRIILQIEEADMRFVRVGQKGTLLITGIAHEPVDFTLTKITPVASSYEGSNVFRAEAQLDEMLPNLRPGMEGVGKVTTEKHSIGWVLTHGLVDWLRLSLWNWMP